MLRWNQLSQSRKEHIILAPREKALMDSTNASCKCPTKQHSLLPRKKNGNVPLKKPSLKTQTLGSPSPTSNNDQILTEILRDQTYRGRSCRRRRKRWRRNRLLLLLRMLWRWHRRPTHEGRTWSRWLKRRLRGGQLRRSHVSGGQESGLLLLLRLCLC